MQLLSMLTLLLWIPLLLLTRLPKLPKQLPMQLL